jgi:hypothetical protein
VIKLCMYVLIICGVLNSTRHSTFSENDRGAFRAHRLTARHSSDTVVQETLIVSLVYRYNENDVQYIFLV